MSAINTDNDAIEDDDLNDRVRLTVPEEQLRNRDPNTIVPGFPFIILGTEPAHFPDEVNQRLEPIDIPQLMQEVFNRRDQLRRHWQHNPAIANFMHNAGLSNMSQDARLQRVNEVVVGFVGPIAEDFECMICQRRLDNDECPHPSRIVSSNCKCSGPIIFGRECLHTWLMDPPHDTCPVCREIIMPPARQIITPPVAPQAIMTQDDQDNPQGDQVNENDEENEDDSNEEDDLTNEDTSQLQQENEEGQTA